ncbi:MAG TPA: hypothetical protein DEF45_09160 [Rhodopirellula sp.]|nr:hypothetical protein [Rhodopirellula sp.]
MPEFFFWLAISARRIERGGPKRAARFRGGFAVRWLLFAAYLIKQFSPPFLSCRYLVGCESASELLSAGPSVREPAFIAHIIPGVRFHGVLWDAFAFFVQFPQGA